MTNIGIRSINLNWLKPVLLGLSLSILLQIPRTAAAQTFQSPATGYSGITLSGAPGLAYFNNKLYVAFKANDSSNYLYITTSSDGSTFSTPATQYSSVILTGSPALTVFNGVLFIAYLNPSNSELMMVDSTDGVNFSAPYAIEAPGIGPFYSSSSPSLTVFNNQLIIAYLDLSSGYERYSTSTNGATFVGPGPISTYTASSAPALTAYNGILYASFQEASNHDLVVATSQDGSAFTYQTAYSGIQIGGQPSMVGSVYGLVVSFRSNDGYHVLFVTSGNSAAGLAVPATGYTGIRMGSDPGMAVFGTNQIYLAFQSNDSYHILFVTHTN